MLYNTNQDEIRKMYQEVAQRIRQMDPDKHEWFIIFGFGRMRSNLTVDLYEGKCRFYIRGDRGRHEYESDTYPVRKTFENILDELFDYDVVEQEYIEEKERKYKGRHKNIYSVTFDTRYQRMETFYIYHIEAYNAKQAKEDAEDLWYHNHKQHMFHISVSRLPDTEELKWNYFHVLDTRYYTWG